MREWSVLAGVLYDGDRQCWTAIAATTAGEPLAYWSSRDRPQARRERPLSTPAYRRSNRERIRERARAFREEHRDPLREYNAEYYRTHRKAQAGRSSEPAALGPDLRFGPGAGSEEERITRLNVATLVMRAFVTSDLEPSPAAKAYFREALDEDRALEREFASRTAARLASSPRGCKVEGLPRDG